MKKTLLILLLFSACTGAFAQLDRAKGGLSVPRKNKPKTTPKPAPTPSGYVSPFKIDPFKKEFKSDLQVGAEEKQSSVVVEHNNFVTGGDQYKDRVTIKPRGESNEALKGNVDFGIIRTKSPYIVLMAYDFGAEDGDRVKITLNDRILYSNIMLSNYGQGIMVNLTEGFNDLRIEALNQGTQGPNTGGFTIIDNKEAKLKNDEWNLLTGFYGKFLILREKE